MAEWLAKTRWQDGTSDKMARRRRVTMAEWLAETI